MKILFQITSIFFSIIYLPISWYMNFLLYSHVRATDLMWVLFWINVPLSIFAVILGALSKEISNKL